VSLYLHATGDDDRGKSVCLVPSETTPRGVRTFSTWAAKLDAARFPALVALAKTGQCEPFGRLAKDVRAALALPKVPAAVRSVLSALDEAAGWCGNPDLLAFWSDEAADVGFDDEG